jgi:hypothetical protein
MAVSMSHFGNDHMLKLIGTSEQVAVGKGLCR